MKRLKKFSVSVALTACLMAFGASSAFAAYGWGDTMDTAKVVYFPGGGSYSQSYVPLEGSTDHDWYVINNSTGSDYVDYSVILTPPAGMDLQFQYVRTDAYNNIISSNYVNYNGPGYAEGQGATVFPGEKHFFRVMPVGANDYDPNSPYTFEFRRTN